MKHVLGPYKVKLETNSTRRSRKLPNIQKLNRKERVKEERVKMKLKMYFELNKNDSLVYQNFCMNLKQGINNIKCFYLKKKDLKSIV